MNSVVAVGSLISLCALLVPQVEIRSADALFDNNPTTFTFTVQNQSAFELSDVTATCVVHNASSPASPGFFQNDTLIDSKRSYRLKRGAQTSIDCSNGQIQTGRPGEYYRVDLTVHVKFAYFFSKFHLEGQQRFSAGTGLDGKLHWFPQADSDKALVGNMGPWPSATKSHD
jgi:hypothetical protein